MLRYLLHQHHEHVCRPGPPQHVWPPLKFSIKPDAVPPCYLHSSHDLVPVHWQDEVNKQLVRDVEFGIMKQVHTNKPTVW